MVGILEAILLMAVAIMGEVVETVEEVVVTRIQRVERNIALSLTWTA